MRDPIGIMYNNLPDFVKNYRDLVGRNIITIIQIITICIVVLALRHLYKNHIFKRRLRKHADTKFWSPWCSVEEIKDL